MARTDIRAVDGLDAAIDRAKALVDAGADAIFPEAMRDLGEFEAIRAAVDVPILANMTEFGKSDLFRSTSCATSASTWSSSRCRCCASRWAPPSAGLDAIAPRVSQEPVVGEMQPRADCTT